MFEDSMCPKCGCSIRYRRVTGDSHSLPVEVPALAPGQGTGNEIVMFEDGIVGKRALRQDARAYMVHFCSGGQPEYR